MILSHVVLLRIRNVVDKSCRENQNTYCMFNNFYSENRSVYVIMQKTLYSQTYVPLDVLGKAQKKSLNIPWRVGSYQYFTEYKWLPTAEYENIFHMCVCVCLARVKYVSEVRKNKPLSSFWTTNKQIKQKVEYFSGPIILSLEGQEFWQIKEFLF